MSTTDTPVERWTGTWTIDPSRSSVEFSVKHMMITTVKGNFGQVEGTIQVNGDSPEAWQVEVNIDASSIDTRADQRDTHLRSADFLDVENYPSLTFHSKRIVGSFEAPGDEFKIVGDLTIRGTTREVTLTTTYEGMGRDPWGADRMSFNATTRIDRSEFGLTWNQALEAGGVLVGNDIKISLDVQLVKQA